MAKLAVAAAIVVGVCTSSGGGSPARHSRGKSFGLTATSSASYIDLRRDFRDTRASRSQPIKLVTPTTLARPPTRTYASLRQINDLSDVRPRIEACESGSRDRRGKAIVGTRDYAMRAFGPARSGVASWLDSTWNGYGGFAYAALAPPALQEQRFGEDLARHGTAPWLASINCWN